MAVGELVGFLLMAAVTTARRDHRGDCCPVVFEGIGVGRLRPMALVAANRLAGVCTSLPVVDDARRGLLVAFPALLRTDGHHVVRPAPPRLCLLAEYLHPL